MTHPSDPGPAPVLALKGISKSFGAVRALRDVSLELFPGEVHALAGENGAGKSTLIKTLAGVHRPDAGQVLLDGAPVVFHGPGDARDAGIAVIYQEPTLFPDLSIAENIFMGRQPRRALRRIDHRAAREATTALMQRLGVALDPDRPARGLSIADQQIVEIVKALSFDARVLIMDEPTAALTHSEVARLFGVVRALRDQGAAVLFISHRLEEIFEICRRVTTLRDGARIASEPLGGMAAAQYLSGSKYKGKVKLTGLGTPNDMRKYVENGTVEAFELWDPAKLGELAARTAVALASGQITGQEGETCTAGAMGEYTIGKDGVINLGKPTVFNAGNIDQFDF